MKRWLWPIAPALALLAACVSTLPPAVSSWECPGCSLPDVVAAVLETGDAIDAKVQRFEAAPDASSVHIWLLREWRQPVLESPLLQVEVSERPDGVHLELRVVPLASLVDDRRASSMPALPATCPSCAALEPAGSPGVAVSTGRALVAADSARRAFVQAVGPRLTLLSGSPDPAGPAPSPAAHLPG